MALLRGWVTKFRLVCRALLGQGPVTLPTGRTDHDGLDGPHGCGVRLPNGTDGDGAGNDCRCDDLANGGHGDVPLCGNKALLVDGTYPILD